MNWKRLLPFLAVLLVVFGISLGEILSNAAKMPVDASKKLPPWPKEIVKRFASMPVQEEGRVKPLETLADYQLLAFHGTRTLRLKIPMARGEPSSRPSGCSTAWFIRKSRGTIRSLSSMIRRR